jgi:pilus assembly protein CpaF
MSTSRRRTTVRDLDEVVARVCRESVDVRGDVRRVVTAQTDRLAPLLTPHDRDLVISRSVARLDGLDSLDEYLADPAVDEVMVNRGREVWVDREGTLRHVADLPIGAVDVVLERVLAPIGKRLDRTTPIVDARLPDGARLCAVVAPVAIDGTTLSVRRHRRRSIPLERFAPTAVSTLLEQIVALRSNILITGATSSGKTSLLAALARRTDDRERLVVIEDTSEVVLDGHHVVRLEARSGGVDGVRPVEMTELVRTALRLRPDRLVVGEFRGPEVLAVVQALNTGHDGSFSTCHANSASDGLRRLETLVMQAAPTWPLAAIRRQVTRSVDAVIHLRRNESGERRIDEIIEVVESGDEPSGRTLVADGVVVGEFRRGRR